MWHKPTYSFRDIPRAMKLAFSAKKIWVGMLGMMLATFFYGVFTYLALIVSGAYFNEIWRIWHFIPIPVGESFNTPGTVLFIFGIIGGIIILLYTQLAIGKITFEQLKGNEFYEINAAISYALKRGSPLIFSPFTILFIIALFLIGGTILGLIARIPIVGKIIFVLFTPLSFFASLFIIYMFFGIIVTLFFAPAVLSSQDADTFDVLFESFSILNEQIHRSIFYEVILAIITFTGVSIFIWAEGKAIWIMEKVFGLNIALGNQFSNMEKIALYYFPQSPLFARIESWLSLLRVDSIIYNVPEMVHVPKEIYFTGVILAVFLYLAFFMALAYAYSIISVGHLFSYLAIAKHKDGIDYLKEEEVEVITPEKEQKGESQENRD